MSTVKLQSVDDQEFEVPINVANMSQTVAHMISDIGGDSAIPLPNVKGSTLAKVIEYCTHYIANPPAEKKAEESAEKRSDDLTDWDKQFCTMEQSPLFELILAANYLDVKPLLEVTCKTVANMIKGKTPEEIRKTFNIKNDFTPEEEEAVRKENEWCQEPTTA